MVLDDPTSEVVDSSTYGGLKAASESELRQAFPDTHLIVRACTMAGPHYNTDRFTYWVRRLALWDPRISAVSPGPTHSAHSCPGPCRFRGRTGRLFDDRRVQRGWSRPAGDVRRHAPGVRRCSGHLAQSGVGPPGFS